MASTSTRLIKRNTRITINTPQSSASKLPSASPRRQGSSEGFCRRLSPWPSGDQLAGHDGGRGREWGGDQEQDVGPKCNEFWLDSNRRQELGRWGDVLGRVSSEGRLTLNRTPNCIVEHCTNEYQDANEV